MGNLMEFLIDFKITGLKGEDVQRKVYVWSTSRESAISHFEKFVKADSDWKKHKVVILHCKLIVYEDRKPQDKKSK